MSVVCSIAIFSTWLVTAPFPSVVAGSPSATTNSPYFRVVETPSNARLLAEASQNLGLDDKADSGLDAYPSELTHVVESWSEDLVYTAAEEGEVSVEIQPLLAVGNYLGMRVVGQVDGGGRSRTTGQHFVSNVDTESVWYLQDLIQPWAIPVWGKYIIEAAAAGVLPLRVIPSPERATLLIQEGLRQGHFTSEGLFIPVPGTNSSLLIYEPDPYLTDDGVLVAQAAIQQHGFVGLPVQEEHQVGDSITFNSNSEVDCDVAKCIALTFDDGPKPTTENLLDILAGENVPATFFLSGDQAVTSPATVQRIAQEGHVLGNHAWSHPQLPELSNKQIRSQLSRTSKVIEDHSGTDPRLFRPPYGAVSQSVYEEVIQSGYAVIQWDIDPQDWETRDTTKIVEQTIENAHPGGIILLHDIYEETVDAVPRIIRELNAEGYVFVTIPQLFDGELQVGTTYYSKDYIDTHSSRGG